MGVGQRLASNGTSGGEPTAGDALWLGVQPHESVAPSFPKVKQNGGSHGCHVMCNSIHLTILW